MGESIKETDLRNMFDEAQKENLWDFGNKILYDMCEANPKHTCKGEVIGKMWLIGRSYAAALERNRKGVKGDKFYESVLGDSVCGNGEDIDKIIEKYKEKDVDIDEMVKDHKKIMNIVHGITEKDNRSFVSKYLHFHCPNAFYIYDERAKTAINRIIDRKSIDESENYDKEYKRFCEKIKQLKEKLEHAGVEKKDLNPRNIDKFLLDYYKKRIENRK